MSDRRDDDRWRGRHRGSPPDRDRRGDREDRRSNERQGRDGRRDDRRSSRSPRRDHDRRRSRSRSPEDGRRTPSPTRREPPRSPAELTPETRSKQLAQRKVEVESLGYSIVDHHSNHTYKYERERKQYPLMTRTKFMSLFKPGPFGAAAMQSVKHNLAFGKNESVTLHVQLDGKLSRQVQITDEQSFEAWENYLIRSIPSSTISRAGVVVVEMHLDMLVKNLLDKKEEKSSHARGDVQLMNDLKATMGKTKGQKGSSGKWNPKCSEMLANSDRADAELKKYLEARQKAGLAFGCADYLLSPLTMLCPFASCSAPTHTLNGLSGLSFFFSPKTAHLKTMHSEDPVAKLLIKRLAAVHGDGGNLLTPETLDTQVGPLQLDYDWLESNMALSAADPPLSRIRKPSAVALADRFCPQCLNSDEGRAEWITANKSAGPSSAAGPSEQVD